MATERKEPTLSASKNIPIDSGSKTPSSSRPSAKPAQPKVIVQKQSSALVWFTFLMSFCAAMAVAYLYWQSTLTGQLTQAQQQRINQLENKLLLTGDESTQSVAALSANLKTQAASLESMQKDIALSLSEVDKLWATRKANLQAIEKATADLGKQITQGDEKINSEITQQVSQQSTMISGLEQGYREQDLLIRSLRERLSEQDKTIKNSVAQIRQFAAASKQVDAIDAKVNGYEETIRSFDKFRLTTNRDLLLLKERAGILSAPSR